MKTAAEKLEILEEIIPYFEGQIWTMNALKAWEIKAKKAIRKAKG